MKRFVLIMLSIFTCAIACAQTETVNWYVDEKNYATTTCQTGGDIDLPITPYKKGYTFQGWEKRVKYVEYVVSKGTNYIDTGVKDFYYPTIETKFQMLSQCDCDWFGCSNNIINWNFSNIDNTPYIRYGNSNSRSLTFVNGHSAHDLNFYQEAHTLKYGFDGDYNTGVVYVDGELVANIDIRSANFSNSSILIGAARTSSHAKWYSFKIWNYDGTLLFDGQPAIDKYGVAGIYDRVKGDFIGGRDGFLAGPVIDE